MIHLPQISIFLCVAHWKGIEGQFYRNFVQKVLRSTRRSNDMRFFVGHKEQFRAGRCLFSVVRMTHMQPRIILTSLILHFRSHSHLLGIDTK